MFFPNSDAEQVVRSEDPARRLSLSNGASTVRRLVHVHVHANERVVVRERLVRIAFRAQADTAVTARWASVG